MTTPNSNPTRTISGLPVTALRAVTGRERLVAPLLPRRAFDRALRAATALAGTLPADAARELAHAVTAAVVAQVWQRRAPTLPLRPPFAEGGTVALCAAARGLAAHFGDLLESCDTESASAAFGEIYTAMLPRAFRKTHGIYYTPPALAALVSDRATDAGVDWRVARVLDPACGGGAILLPALRRICDALAGEEPTAILAAVGQRLRGRDLDPVAGWLAQVSIDLALLDLVAASGQMAPRVIHICDSLDAEPDGEKGAAPFDAILGNPPYGQVALPSMQKARFERSTFGRANLYGLFFDRAVELVRPGGVISYLTPTGFLGGEYFKNLRQLLAEHAPPVAQDFVADRRGVFAGVLQETVLTTCRRGGTPGPVDVSEVRLTGEGVESQPITRAALPASPDAPWPFPRRVAQAPFAPNHLRTPARLADWGYAVRTGPIDGSDRSRDGAAGPAAVPLVWPEAVSAAGLAWPAAKRGRSAWYRADGREHLLVRAPCLLLQRTTALEQPRRLVGALLDAAFLARHAAVAVENHLNILEPCCDAAVPLPVLAAYFNSAAADAGYRCLSGTTAVSAYELRALALPAPDRLGPLGVLIAQGACREEIETECTRLVLGAGAQPGLRLRAAA